jgi:hypothetical protein
MLAAQIYSIPKSNGNAVAKNSDLSNPKKVNFQTNSNNGKSKSSINLKSEHQRSENQNTIFPESDHQKKQVAPHKKDVAKKQA